ncbi:hypothetical protein L9F63_008338, partial [Diploptera punctata]
DLSYRILSYLLNHTLWSNWSPLPPALVALYSTLRYSKLYHHSSLADSQPSCDQSHLATRKTIDLTLICDPENYECNTNVIGSDVGLNDI